MAIKWYEQSKENDTVTESARDWLITLPAIIEDLNRICELLIITVFVRFLTQFERINR